jgi:hypothetical protein
VGILALEICSLTAYEELMLLPADLRRGQTNPAGRKEAAPACEL